MTGAGLQIESFFRVRDVLAQAALVLAVYSLRSAARLPHSRAQATYSKTPKTAVHTLTFTKSMGGRVSYSKPKPHHYKGHVPDQGLLQRGILE